jgi:hypothetical protein
MSSHEIKPTDTTIPDAYHGTSKANAEIILREGFKPSVGEKQYLGDGVYFFESSKHEAVTWARRTYDEHQVAVIHAMIRLGRCFDLYNHEYLTFFVNFAERLRQEAEQRHLRSGRPMVTVTDALVVNLIAQKVKIDTVRAGRSRRARRMFPGSNWFLGQQIIICVRNIHNISDVRMA